MKKTTLLLLSILAFASCKKTTTQETVVDESTAPKPDSTAVVADCATDSIILAYKALADGEKPQWLRDHGHLICDNNLYECLEPFHSMQKDSLDKLIKAHPENATRVKTYSKKWIDIKTFISGVDCYDKYLGFTFSGSTMNLKLLDTFTETETCYSIPFIKAAGANLHANDLFKFSKAMIPKKVGNTTVVEEKVVLVVQKGTGGTATMTYYNHTDNPLIPQ